MDIPAASSGDSQIDKDTCIISDREADAAQVAEILHNLLPSSSSMPFAADPHQQHESATGVIPHDATTASETQAPNVSLEDRSNNNNEPFTNQIDDNLGTFTLDFSTRNCEYLTNTVNALPSQCTTLFSRTSPNGMRIDLSTWYIYSTHTTHHPLLTILFQPNRLCYTYARSSSNISYALPAYYADRLYDLGRSYLRDFFFGSKTVHGSLDVDDKKKDKEKARCAARLLKYSKPTNETDKKFSAKSEAEALKEKLERLAV
jgi:hypothetical protein